MSVEVGCMEGPRRMRAARIRTDFRLELRLHGNVHSASARDIGPGGMRVRVKAPAKPDDHLSLKLLLSHPHDLAITAQVRWAREEAPGSWLLGLRFSSTTDLRRKLEYAIQELRSGKLGVTRTTDTRRVPP